MFEIYPCIPNSEYHNSPLYAKYISSTELKHYLVSPKYYKYRKENPKENPDTDAVRFGSLFHGLMQCLADFPDSIDVAFDKFRSRISVFKPPVNKYSGKPYGNTSQAYSDAYAAFVENNKDKFIATEEEVGLAVSMAESMLYNCGETSKNIRNLIRWVKSSEASYFIQNKNGIYMKARPDMLTSKKLIDWKTCSLDSLDEDNIARQIIKYRYDVSLSFYQYVLYQVHKQWFTPYLVFASKKPPYEAVICDMSEWCYNHNNQFDVVGMGVGAMEFERLLKLHTECTKNNDYPGIDAVICENGNHIMNPRIPSWLTRKYFEE